MSGSRHCELHEAAFIDANVLVHAWTTDVVLSLADVGMFEPLWSERVLKEAHEALCKMRPTAVAQIDSYIDAVRRSNRYASVPEKGLAIDSVELPDPDDAHVVAAAARGGARWVVTYNLKDFPCKELATLGLEPISPDSFLCTLLARDNALVTATMRKLVTDKRRPPRTMDEELAGLRKNSLEAFADALEKTLGANSLQTRYRS